MKSLIEGCQGVPKIAIPQTLALLDIFVAIFEGRHQGSQDSQGFEYGYLGKIF